MRKFAGLVIIVVVISGIAGFVALKSLTPKKTSQITPSKQISKQALGTSENVDYKAGFVIFTNSIKRSFAAAKYHNLSGNVFIETTNPNIVHVKKPGVTWDDFFKTLPMKLTYDCLTTGDGETFCTQDESTLKFYLNGVKTFDLLDREIKDGDRALISYGNENETQIKQQLDFVDNPKSPNQ